MPAYISTNTECLCWLQVRSKLQTAMGRPVALDDVQSMTIGQVKALEGTDDPAEAAALEAQETVEASAGSKPMVSLASIAQQGAACLGKLASC